jgi:hypothetical protein
MRTGAPPSPSPRPYRPSSAHARVARPPARPRSPPSKAVERPTFVRPSSARALLSARQGSMLGRQHNARFVSAPAYSWGAAGVGPASPRIYISKELTADLLGHASPGPVYHPGALGKPSASFSFGVATRMDLVAMDQKHRTGHGQLKMPGSFGRQLEAHKPTAPAASFGRSRLPAQGQLAATAQGDYDYAPGFGATSSDSRRRTGASYGMGRSERFFVQEAHPSPGPGTYTLGSAHGKQLTSDKPTRPVSSFSKAKRSNGSAMAVRGGDGPGPIYSPRRSGAFGGQVSSARRSTPSVSFGTSDRFAAHGAMMSPGPAAYHP